LLAGHGAVRGVELPVLAHILAGFAIGLPFFSAFQLMTRTLYAMHDSRTPALVNIGVAVVNISADLLLAFAWHRGVTGLALGHAVSYVFGSALLFVIGGLVLYQRGRATATSSAAQQQTPVNAASEDDAQDQQVLAQIARSRPELKESYERHLKQVNASIRESKQALERDPDDGDARTGLLSAYEQKAMVYDMAARSLQ